MYKLLSTETRRFYREYTWKPSTAKVLPSETYPLYGSFFCNKKQNHYNWKTIAIVIIYKSFYYEILSFVIKSLQLEKPLQL